MSITTTNGADMRYYTKSVSFKGLQYVVKDREQDDKTVYMTRSFNGAKRRAAKLEAEALKPLAGESPEDTAKWSRIFAKAATQPASTPGNNVWD